MIWAELIVISLDTDNCVTLINANKWISGFDIRAFRRCAESITQLNQDNPEELQNWSDKFTLYWGIWLHTEMRLMKSVKEIVKWMGH